MVGTRALLELLCDRADGDEALLTGLFWKCQTKHNYVNFREGEILVAKTHVEHVSIYHGTS